MLCMPFGVKNAPAPFQRMINRNWRGRCQQYIDDVIVYGDYWEQHLNRVRHFLERLRMANLRVNLVKMSLAPCDIFRTRGEPRAG